MVRVGKLVIDAYCGVVAVLRSFILGWYIYLLCEAFHAFSLTIAGVLVFFLQEKGLMSLVDVPRNSGSTDPTKSMFVIQSALDLMPKACTLHSHVITQSQCALMKACSSSWSYIKPLVNKHLKAQQLLDTEHMWNDVKLNRPHESSHLPKRTWWISCINQTLAYLLQCGILTPPRCPAANRMPRNPATVSDSHPVAKPCKVPHAPRFPLNACW